jgi:hypothetical protein
LHNDSNENVGAGLHFKKFRAYSDFFMLINNPFVGWRMFCATDISINLLENHMPRGIPNSGVRKTAARKTTRVVGQPRDPFKISDIKEDALVSAVAQRAGAQSDPAVSGFIKSVIPRYADWSAQQGIKSMSNMAKEFNKAGQTGGSGSSGESRAQANGEPTSRKRPGRPRKTTAKSVAKSVSDKGQASGGKRRPGRPRKDNPSA